MKKKRNAGKFYYCRSKWDGTLDLTTIAGPASLEDIEGRARNEALDDTYRSVYVLLKPWTVVRANRRVEESTLAYTPKRARR